MVKTKILSVVILGCTIMMYKPAKAFWPVMDFGEVPEIVSSVNTAIGSLSEAKSQIMEMKKTLDAIGQSINNIAQFGQDLRNTISDIQEVANNAIDGINENLGTNIEIPEKINDSFDATNNALDNNLNNLIDETESILNKGNEYIDKGSSGIDSVQKASQKADEGMQKLNAKNEVEKAKREQASEEIEEEEEEEEVADDEELFLQKEEIIDNITAFEDESKQVIAQMSDVLDTAINTLNQSSKRTNEILDNLEKSIKASEQLEIKDKENIAQKVADLKNKYQNVADKSVILIENAKENYNTEYQNKLIDEIQGYKNIVESYFRGDASKEDVIKKGKELKMTYSQIDINIDKEVLKQQQKATEEIKKELKAIASEVEAKKKN